jgi:sugar phosphate isomerase/epimerase
MADHAASRGITLAIESRSHYEQIPSEREMVTLLDHFADHPAVGYWHDFGHVQRKHNLALLDHAQWLTRMLPHLVGCHVHDVEWPERDHRVPFHGDMELARLLEIVPHHLPLVWELSLSRRRVHIRQGKKIWDELFACEAS